MKQAEQDMIRKLAEYQSKSMEADAELILSLAEAARLILSVTTELQSRHKYDLFPIEPEQSE